MGKRTTDEADDDDSDDDVGLEAPSVSSSDEDASCKDEAARDLFRCRLAV